MPCGMPWGMLKMLARRNWQRARGLNLFIGLLDKTLAYCFNSPSQDRIFRKASEMGASFGKGKHVPSAFERLGDPSIYVGLEKKYEYENLVFASGGVRGIAYTGAIKVLKDVGILDNIKRFAGSSVGAIVAMGLAVGASTDDLLKEMLPYYHTIMYKSRKSRVTMYRNLVKVAGLSTGEEMLRLFRRLVKKYTGDENLTFKQLYETRGVELWVIVTNMRTQMCEYWGPLTTCDVPIAVAVRASCSAPIHFQPVKYPAWDRDMPGLYVDGGETCHYPITVFDSWDPVLYTLLPSMEYARPWDSGEERKKEKNKKTLGLTLFNANDGLPDFDAFKNQLYAARTISRPKTRVAALYGREEDATLGRTRDVSEMPKASRKLLRLLDKLQELRGDGNITTSELKTELENAVKWNAEEDFNAADWERLFGNLKVERFTGEISRDYPESISVNNLVHLMTNQAGPLRGAMITGTTRTTFRINTPLSMVTALQTFVNKEIRQHQEIGEDRTIPIYIDYVLDAFETGLTREDSAYLVTQGYFATVKFLKDRASGIE